MKTLKGKISIGVIFLFGVILILSISGIIFINQLAEKTRGTTDDNYATVDYVMNMLKALDDIYTQNLMDRKKPLQEYSTLTSLFEKNLELESNNITERNEGRLVTNLHSSWNDFHNTFAKQNNSQPQYDTSLQQKYLAVRSDLMEIYRLNMNAIDRKTTQTEDKADDVILYMSLLGIISVLITFIFVFVFPSKIVGPIKMLTEKIKSISEKKYDQKADINSDDELGALAKAFNTMAERLKTYEARQIDRLLFEQKRLQAVVQSTEDGILLMDETRKVVLTNNTIKRITGLPEEEILHKNIYDIAGKNDLIKEILKAANHKSLADSGDIKPIRVFLNNSELYYSVETEEIITYSEAEEKETFIGNLILLRDISKFQEKDRAKTNLLATASHEFKTPLSSINLSLKLLEDKRIGDMNEEQKEVIRSLRQQSGRLSRVINELLDYSQIESGNIRLNFTTVKPDLILDIGLSSLMMQLSEKEIELKTEIEENLPEINVDIEKLAFVFINILNNAIRYSPKGGEIIVAVKRTDDRVEFSVKDNGPGIPKEEQVRLFRRYEQLGSRAKQSWGLGLAISKEFLQAQNGRIWLQSEPGKGSTFTFGIPVCSVN